MAARPPQHADATARMRTLLQRWQQSLDLHLRYLTLDDAHYWHVQPWPKHERPAAWIVQLAREKVVQLSRQLEAHAARGDHQFALGLEHMSFLANLVGLQPAERHIPLADKTNERREALGRASGETTTRRALPRNHAPAPAPAPETDHTREMPRPRPARSTRAAADKPAPAPAAPPTAAERLIIEDAVRLLQWGRQWHELGELISRIAERPGLSEVRRTLRAHRARIERAASAPAPAG